MKLIARHAAARFLFIKVQFLLWVNTEKEAQVEETGEKKLKSNVIQTSFFLKGHGITEAMTSFRIIPGT